MASSQPGSEAQKAKRSSFIQDEVQKALQLAGVAAGHGTGGTGDTTYATTARHRLRSKGPLAPPPAASPKPSMSVPVPKAAKSPAPGLKLRWAKVEPKIECPEPAPRANPQIAAQPPVKKQASPQKLKGTTDRTAEPTKGTTPNPAAADTQADTVMQATPQKGTTPDPAAEPMQADAEMQATPQKGTTPDPAAEPTMQADAEMQASPQKGTTDPAAEPTMQADTEMQATPQKGTTDPAAAEPTTQADANQASPQKGTTDPAADTQADAEMQVSPQKGTTPNPAAEPTATQADVSMPPAATPVKEPRAIMISQATPQKCPAEPPATQPTPQKCPTPKSTPIRSPQLKRTRLLQDATAKTLFDGSQQDAPSGPEPAAAGGSKASAADPGPGLRSLDTMTTQTMAAMGKAELEMPSGMMEMLCKHFFKLEAYEPVGADAEQEAWMKQLTDWALEVFGGAGDSDERRPFKVDMSHAVAAAQAAGTKMNPYECQFKLSPAVVSVNEALASLRAGKETMDSIAEKRAAVQQQGENMIHQLKAKLEQGEIAEEVMISKSQVVVQWQSKKDSELDVALGDMESELCIKVETACNFILDAWTAIAAPAIQLQAIPENDDDILMELEMGLQGFCPEKEQPQKPLEQQLQTAALAEDKQNNGQTQSQTATEDKQNNDQTQSQTNGSAPTEDKQNSQHMQSQTDGSAPVSTEDKQSSQHTQSQTDGSALMVSTKDKQNSQQTQSQTDGSAMMVSTEDKQNSHQTQSQTDGSAQDKTVAQQQLLREAVVEAETLQRKSGGNGAVNKAIDAGLVDDVLKHPEKYNVQDATLKRKEGESEEEHIYRIAHNVYMKFHRSTKSSKCPPEVIAAVQKTKGGGTKLEDLFLEYLRSSGDWLQSTLVLKAKSKTSRELKHEECYTMFKDLKKVHGPIVAKSIRDEKRQLQEKLDAEPDPATLPWILPHPDLPGSEEHELVRVWDSATITSSSKNSTQAIITSGEMDLTGQQTRELLPVVMQLGNALPGQSSSSRLPTPHGLMTRGSAEDLAKEAEEYKKLRKSGKNSFPQQVKAKSKAANDKLEELKGLKDQLALKPAHMSEPLRVGYDAELDRHATSLNEAVEILKGDALAEDAEQQQAALDALNEKMKAYQDAASMIRKKLAEPKPKSEAKAKAKGKAKGKAKAKAK